MLFCLFETLVTFFFITSTSCFLLNFFMFKNCIKASKEFFGKFSLTKPQWQLHGSAYFSSFAALHYQVDKT